MELFFIILLNFLHGAVNAHFTMTVPSPRAQNFNPIPGNERGISDAKFVCGGADTAGTATNFAVGTQKISMVQNAANHCGDCFAYISYDIDKPSAEQNFFLIAKAADYVKEGSPLGDGGADTIIVPDWLPSKQAIFRWQCFTLHQGPPEYYAYCADVTITGGAAADAPYPVGQTMIGHMPTDGYGTCQTINHAIGPIGNPLIETGPGNVNPGVTPTSSPTPPPKVLSSSPTQAPANAPPMAPEVPAPAVCKDHPGETANCGTLKLSTPCTAAWMITKCSKTCDLCDTCPPDSNENCEYWANLNPSECTKDKQSIAYMNANCRNACGYCDGDGTKFIPDSGGAHLKVSGLVWFVAVVMLAYC